MSMNKAIFVLVPFAFAAWTPLRPALGQNPDHPIITEVYTDPVGLNDGPVGRDPSSAHQEFIEIYLPPASSLRASLNKDALNLTFYEVEGDDTSSGLSLVNYRFDLPTFDLDLSNGTTAGAVARPAGGVIVLGWVDYVGDPPTALAGTPSSRVALINGGVTSTSGYTFIAINGNHFGATTNFPSVLAESLIDVPSETRSGIVQNGSGVYLLMNRDSSGYVELFDDKHVPGGSSADPRLPQGNVLTSAATLDAFASNDHSLFDVFAQPYNSPTGDDIDLETVLPRGGAFSRLAAQVPEIDVTSVAPGMANGYARLFPDVAKTTENGTSGDDDPVADALNAYRHVRNGGPFYPSPGYVALTDSAPRLSAVGDAVQVSSLLAQTTRSVAILSANIGGDFPIDIAAVPGPSSDPTAVSFTSGAAASNVTGQMLALPKVGITAEAGAADGAAASSTISITASNANGGDPAVESPLQTVTASATVLNPTRGLDAQGRPLQTTVFLAIQPVFASPAANELLDTDLGAFVSANLGGAAQDTSGNGPLLIDPTSDLSDPATVLPLVKEFPSENFLYINPPGPPGRLDFAQTVLQSAEMLSGADTYIDSVTGSGDAVRAISLNMPDTITFGGTFSPSEVVHFSDSVGLVGSANSALTNVTTTRGFELALIDADVRFNGSFESGNTDDFGIVVEVLDTEPGSPVVAGEFVFLSFSGGLQGADVDTLGPPPGTDVLANIIYLDLDNLHSVLGIRTLERILLIDSADQGPEVDIIELFTLNPIVGGPTPCPGDLDGDRDVDLSDLAVLLSNFGTPSGATPNDGDIDGDGDVDLTDLAVMLSAFGATCP